MKFAALAVTTLAATATIAAAEGANLSPGLRTPAETNQAAPNVVAAPAAVGAEILNKDGKKEQRGAWGPGYGYGGYGGWEGPWGGYGGYGGYGWGGWGGYGRWGYGW